MSASLQRQDRCCHCRSSSVNPRNLVVFIDGTSNKPGPEDTNVRKLYGVIPNEGALAVEQKSFYLKGIGAHELVDLPLSNCVPKAIYSIFEMAFACNVAKNVKKAYSWLVANYREGDQIYLFGFSRGAYQVRTLAGMIHEVGLVTRDENTNTKINAAYQCYRSIDRNNHKSQEMAVEFKEKSCWQGVRIHFVGVWDTVSSLGLAKQYIQVTASASVTNACHFRHALSLDERRVKFMPEYFLELNAHHSNVQSPREVVSDVKEVWFAGCHSDVGGASRPYSKSTPYFVHAGNVPLVWMRREASSKGLVFRSEMFPWRPEDIDLGRVDSMGCLWRIFEFVRFRHQVSFSGTGKHAKMMHLFRPRSVIPGQQIHPSIFPGDLYTPRATLAYGIKIPTLPRVNSPWQTETVTDLVDDETATELLSELLLDQQRTLQSLGEVLFLLNLKLDDGQIRMMPASRWTMESICERLDFEKFALTIIYDVISEIPASDGLVTDAQNYLEKILRSTDDTHFSTILYMLQFSTRHKDLRRRFVAHDKVIDALIPALDQITKTRTKSHDLFPLIIDSLCYLIDDSSESHRASLVDQLTTEIKPGKTKLSLILELKEPSHLMASLRMIASLAPHQPDLCRILQPKIIKLAKENRNPVGLAAIEALVALNMSPPYDFPISNVLSYLSNTLPPLDAEFGNASTPNAIRLPRILQVDDRSGELNEILMHKLVSTIESKNADQRIAATLTLLKLSDYQIVRNFCSREGVLDTFRKQMKNEKTSLLAAYALMTLLRHKMWTRDHFRHIAPLVVNMVEKGWFDDAVGRVEGPQIFRKLMNSAELKKQVIDHHIFTTLTEKLATGDCHETRMSLICLEILGGYNTMELTRIVANSLRLLVDKDTKKQKRGTKTLSSLAQTKPGEQVIQPHLAKIVEMLLPSDGSPPPRYKLFGPTATLYNLCKNETLHEEVKKLTEYETFKNQRTDRTLYPQSKSMSCPVCYNSQ